MGDWICGGGHYKQGSEWTKAEIDEHIKAAIDGSCMACYLGTPFRCSNPLQPQRVVKKYYSCNVLSGQFCSKHQVRHKVVYDEESWQVAA